jgi:3-oxoacyl-[acyl-carrier-protein] synthase II
MKRQPVITGLGIVSPIGIGVDRFWSAALAGRSGIGTPTLFDGSKAPAECRVVGEVQDFNPLDWMSPQIARIAARFSQFGIAAARMARIDSGVDAAGIPAEHLKVFVGNSMEGHADLGETTHAAHARGRPVSPWATNEYPSHAATSHIAIDAGARAQTMTFSTACAAGLDAIGWAQSEIRDGKARAVIAGGTETPLSAFSLTFFHAAGVLSTWQGAPDEASRPFDQWRSGLVLAEGAAMVVIEDEEFARARGAPMYARILSFASTSEGAHLRKVDASGSAVARAITMAMNQAGLEARDIDFVSAHGNSMPDYDAAETAGIKQALRAHAWNIPVSSLKSMCGQALAASSAMQVVSSCLTMRDNIVTPTINYKVPDPKCDLDYVPNVARVARVRNTVIHAHSLGGSHVAMILGAPD